MSMPSPVDRYLAGLEGSRAAHPPTQVDSLQDPPRFFTEQERLGGRKEYMQKMLHAAGLVPKALAHGFSFATKSIERIDDFTQITVATLYGRIPITKYPKYVSDVMHGRKTVTGSEWMRLMIGYEVWNNIKDSSFIPGWTKKVVVPDAFLGAMTVTKPRVTLEAAANLGVELIVSPFALGGLLPKNFFTATRVGKLLAGPQVAKGIKLGFDPASSVATFPLRKLASAAFSPSGPFGALLMHARGPQDVFTGELRSRTIEAGDALHAAAEEIGTAVRDIAKAHKQGIFRNRGGLSKPELAGVWKHLFIADQKLDARQGQVLNDLMDRVIVPWYNKLKDSGHHVVKVPGVPGRHRWSPLPGARTRFQPYLREMLGSIHSFRLLGAPRSAPSAFMQTRTMLPFKRGPLPYDPARLLDLQMDPFHAVEQWASSAARKAVLERNERLRIVRPNGSLKRIWSPRGLLNLYRAGKGGERWEGASAAYRARIASHIDPLVRDAASEVLALGPNGYAYLQGKFRDFSGHRAGSIEIMLDNVMDRFFANLDPSLGAFGPARINRVRRYLLERAGGRLGVLGQPRQTRISAIAGLMTQNIVVSTLGLNLASAIRNTSQLVNTAASEGIPATIRGIYRLALAHSRLDGKPGSIVGKLGGRSEILAQVRADLRLRSAMSRLTYDDVWSLGLAGRNKFTDWVLTPFNAVENVMRGIASNVAAEQWLTRAGVKTLADYNQLSGAGRQALLRFAREGAIDTNFLYGVAGRSHLMMSPPARVGFALQSYSWHEAEFIARVWQRDGSAPIRLWAMQGWLIDMMDRVAGVNAENWLGWGFLPPSGQFGQSPIIEAWSGLLGFQQAAAEARYDDMDREVNRMRGGVREIFRLIGLDPNDHVGTQAILGGLTSAGLLPIPVVAIGKSARAVYAFQTGAIESGSGRSWIPITRADAIKSAFFTLHVQAEDQRLRAMDRVTRGKVDRELGHRVSKLMSALEGREGTSVMEAAAALYTYIPVNLPLSGVHPGTWGFLGDESGFWPHPEMLERRLQEAVLRKALAGPVREMLDSGWVFEVLWNPYIQAALQAIERGAIRGMGA